MIEQIKLVENIQPLTKQVVATGRFVDCKWCESKGYVEGEFVLCAACRGRGTVLDLLSWDPQWLKEAF